MRLNRDVQLNEYQKDIRLYKLRLGHQSQNNSVEMIHDRTISTHFFYQSFVLFGSHFLGDG